MRIILIFLVTVFLFATADGQSGRRVQTRTVVPAPVAPVQGAESVSGESVGYSESSPSRSTPLTRTGRKSKKEFKKGTPTAAATDAPNSDDADVIRVETSLVTIPVSVSDRDGFYVAALHQRNFKVFENGVEQKIEYFGTSDKPFTVVLLIDVSPSTAYKIDEIQAAAAAFVEQLMPHDRVTVIEFDSSVRMLAEPTSDREKILKGIRKTGFGGGTSLYKAVDFSLRKSLEKVEGRKAIVLFTDGVDTTSSGASYNSTLEKAEESEAGIFPIYYNTFLRTIGIGGGSGPMTTPATLGLPGSMGGGQATREVSEAYTRGRVYLNELATVTGGKVYRAESTPGGLTAAFESIADELRRQYVIGYYPGDSGSPGDRKGIRVRVDRPKLVIRTRDSYIVGEK